MGKTPDLRREKAHVVHHDVERGEEALDSIAMPADYRQPEPSIERPRA